MTDAYRDDLAYIHDAGFGRFAQAAGPVLLEELSQRGVKEGLVIEISAAEAGSCHASCPRLAMTFWVLISPAR